CLVFYSIFFFQAEDGIRDATVTGVQTCALPISALLQDDDRAKTSHSRLAYSPTESRCSPSAASMPAWNSRLRSVGLLPSCSPHSTTPTQSCGASNECSLMKSST